MLENNDSSANPNAAQVRWYYLNNFSAESYLNAMYNCKNESTQVFIKMIQGYYVLKFTFRLKCMVHLIALHKFPIISQTEIIDNFQTLYRRLLIIKQKSFVFQYNHLISKTYRLLCAYYHRCIKNQFRPDTHCKEAWRKLLMYR